MTRPRPHVDRLACVWLIRRYLNPDAVIRYAAEPEPGEVGFDMDGAEFSHQGNLCTFEVMLRAFQLGEATLSLLAEIVRAADIAADLHSDEIAPGLEAIASGFSLILPDDQANLEKQFIVYDALYAWCRLKVGV